MDSWAEEPGQKGCGCLEIAVCLFASLTGKLEDNSFKPSALVTAYGASPCFYRTFEILEVCVCVRVWFCVPVFCVSFREKWLQPCILSLHHCVALSRFVFWESFTVEHTITHAHTCEEIFKCARMQIHNENWMAFPGGRRMGTDVFLET